MPELNYVAPGPIAASFLKSSAYVRGIRGPIGSGKTALCAMEILRRSIEQKVGPNGKRNSRFAAIRNTQPELKSTTIKTWLDWFPEATFGRFNWATPYTHFISIGDIQLEMMFLALDSEEDVKKLYSLELTGGWINEARFVPKAVVDTLVQRCNRYPAVKDGGATWAGVMMDTNAMDPDHWWPMIAGDVPIPDDMPEEEALMLQKPANWEFFTQGPAVFERKGATGETIGWEINQAAENLANLAPGYYRNALGGQTRSEILRNFGNQIVVVREGKAVYQLFNENNHLAREPIPIQPGATVLCGWDFGLTPAVIFCQMLRGRWLVLRELVSTSMGAKAMAEEVRRVLAREFPGCPVMMWGDPAGDSRAQTDENTPFNIIRAAGLQILPAPSNDFVLRNDAVAEVMRRTTDEGRSGILIDPKCRHLKKACAGGYHYPKVQGAGVLRYADRPSKNMSSHVAEALQYVLLGGGEGRQLLMGDPKSSPKAVTVNTRHSPFDRLNRPSKVINRRR